MVTACSKCLCAPTCQLPRCMGRHDFMRFPTVVPTGQVGECCGCEHSVPSSGRQSYTQDFLALILLPYNALTTWRSSYFTNLSLVSQKQEGVELTTEKLYPFQECVSPGIENLSQRAVPECQKSIAKDAKLPAPAVRLHEIPSTSS